MNISICCSRSTADEIKKNGIGPQTFKTVVGATGGAKILTIGEIDKMLFGSYVKPADSSIHIGSSAGGWRMLCSLSNQPVRSFETLHNGIIHKYDYDGKIDPKRNSRIFRESVSEIVNMNIEQIRNGGMSGFGVISTKCNPSVLNRMSKITKSNFTQNSRKAPAFRPGMESAGDVVGGTCLLTNSMRY